jgi:polyphosphate kinase 2 (PPK2 family)
MEADDWRKVLTAFSKREFVMEDGDEVDADDIEVSEDDGAKADDNAEEVDAEAVRELGEVNVEAVEEATRYPPQWRKEKPLTSTIFDIVDAAGKDGVSSMVRDLSLQAD